MEKNENYINTEKIGIMPIGALSIAFASYIQGVDTFIESRKTHYKVGEKLKISLENEIREIILTEENYTNNISSLINGRMPEIILFSPPNHRLISTLDELIDTISKILELTNYPNDIYNYIPKVVMLSNGIYYDDIISYLTKILEYLDDDIKEKIKGNFIRATTLQTGVRTESDIDIIFKPGTKGSVTIAGGSKESRERIISLFEKYKYPVIEMEGEEVRRIEFDKAIVNLATNGVQLSMIFDDKNQIQYLTFGDIISNKNMQELCKKIIRTMVSIGVKAGIYSYKDIPREKLIDKIYTEEWKKLEEKSRKDNTHIVSTIAIVIERYRKGKAEGKPLRLPPLEENIINYLLKLSKENNLDEERMTIEELRDSILHACGKLWC